MKRLWLFFILLLVSLLFVGCSQPLIQTDAAARPTNEANTSDENPAVAGSSDDAVQRFTIQATKYHFDTPEIRVKQGDTVEITLESMKGYHTLKLEGYNLEVKQNRTISFVATEQGEFIYRCGVVCGRGHHDMIGKLIVE